MSTREFLSHLRTANISLRLESGKLQISAPKDSLTPELIEQLTIRKPEILAFLSRSMSHEPDGRPIERLPRQKAGGLPLSFAQLRLWFLDQLTPGSSAYNISLAMRLHGELDCSLLQRSISEIVHRHEVLRTVFRETDGSPSQVIMQPVVVSIETVDLTHLSGDVIETKAREIASAEAQRPFDLSNGPLFRPHLLRLGQQHHVLQITVHHTVFDGWSIGVLLQELSVLYRAYRAGGPSPLRELPVQYVDFASWQRRTLDESGREAHMAYWREQLGGDLPTLELPTDRPRGENRKSPSAKRRLTLSPSLSRSLKALSQREGASLAMTLMAAFTVLLNRLSGQNDLLVGTPIAGRTRTEFEDMIGCFANTIVIRTKFAESLVFRDHLNAVRKAMLEAHEHQDLPFEELVAALDPHRDLDRTPLFQVLFNHLNLQVEPLQLDGVKSEPFADFDVDSQFDLTLYVRERADSIGFILVYNTDLFEEGRISVLLDQYEHLLDQVCDDPLRPVDEYSLFEASENVVAQSVVAEPLKLREVVAALTAYPGVRDCTVTVTEDPSGGKRLTAYVTSADDGRLDRDGLAGFLKAWLPEQMVPSEFVVLDSIPLTPDGEVDHAALALVEGTGAERQSGQVAPSTHVQRVIAKIWSEVLDVPVAGISVTDNFFGLGGHSLTATRVIARLRSALEIDLPLRSIFTEPTIAGLSKHIRHNTLTRRYQYLSEVPRWKYLVPAQPRGTRPPLFLVAGFGDADETLLLLSSVLTQLGPDQPVYGFKPRWIDGLAGAYSSLEEAASEYLTEVRALQPTGPYLLGGDCINGIVAFEMAQQLRQEGEEVALLVLQDTVRPSWFNAFVTSFWLEWRRCVRIAKTIGQFISGSDKSPMYDMVRRKWKRFVPKDSDYPVVDNHPYKMAFRRQLLAYRPAPYPGRITLLINEKTHRFSKDLGWEGVARAGLAVYRVPGDHHTRLTSNRKGLAEQLLACIDEALSKYTEPANHRRMDAA